MIRYLSLNRNLFYAFIFCLTFLFAGLGNANAQCGTVSASPGFPATGCAGQFVSGQYIEVATASPANVLRWEYSTDGGATWNSISGTAGVNPLTYTYLNTISGGNFYVFRLVYITFACGPGNGTSFTSGSFNIYDPPTAGSFSPSQVSLCTGATGTYSLTGAGKLFATPGDPINTSYSITATGVSNANANLGTATFTRTSASTGTLSVAPTTTTTTNIGTVTYHVMAVNGSCSPVDIGTITVCVYPTVTGGSLSATSASFCTGGSATLSLPGFTGLVNANGSCGGTTYSLSSSFAPASPTCGAFTDGISGAFTTGNTPGTVVVSPTNTSNQVLVVTYTVTITNGPCAPITRTVAITVTPTITPAGISTSTPTSTICTGQTATVNITNLVCGTGYNSAFTTITVSAPTFGGAGAANMAGGAASSITYNANSASFTVSPTITQCTSGTAQYTISAQNAPCAPVVIGSITITVIPAIISGATVGGTTTICSGGSSASSISGANTCANGYGGLTSYTLSVASSGANIASTGLPGTLTNGTGVFTVTPTNTGCSNTGNTVTYNINATNNAVCSSVLVGSFTVTVIPVLNNTGVTVTSPAVPANTVCAGTTTTITINNLVCATGYGSGFTSVTAALTGTTGGVTGGAPGSVTNAATSASFTPGALGLTGCATGTATYTITGQNAPCSPITLGTITLTVIPNVVGGSISGTTTICTGASVTNSTSNFTCPNGHGGLTSYTLSVSGAPGANITSNGLPGTLTNATGVFTVNPTNTTCNNSANTITYQIVATNGSPCSAFSLGTFTVTVTPSPEVTGQTLSVGAASTALCNGGSTTLTVSNNCAGASLTWEQKIGAGAFTPIGSTGSPISTGALASQACAPETYQYRVTATYGTCTKTAVSPVITVYPTISITGLTGNATVCSGASMNLSVSITCAQAGATYELLDGGVPVGSVTTTNAATFATSLANFSITNFTCANISKTYSIRVTNTAANGGCSYTSSAPATFGVTVNPAPSSGGVLAMSVTSSTSICSGTPATLTTNRCAGATATWDVSINGAAFQTIASAGITMTDNFNTTYTTSGLTTSACNTTTYLFRSNFTLGTCGATAVSTNTVSVFPAPTATSATIVANSGGTNSSTTNVDMCSATNSSTITSTAPACGSIARWEYSINGGTSWQTITATTLSITVTNVPQNTIYRAVITNGALCATTFSNTVSVTVSAVTGGTPSTGTPAICTGSSATITLSGQLGNIIDWQSAPTSSFASITSLGTTANPITVSPTSNIWYRAQVASGICTTFSSAILISVYSSPTISSFTSPSPICGTSNTVLSFATSNTVAGVTTYGITSNYPTAGSTVYATNTTAPTSPLTVASSYVNPSGATNYTLTVITSPCAAATSTISVTVYPLPTVTLGSTVNTICNGSSSSLTASATPVVAGTTTYSIDAVPGGNLYASSTTPPSFPFSVTPTATTTYTYTVTNSPCAPVTATTTITVIPQPSITSFTSNSPLCATANTVLTFGTSNTVNGVTSYKITSDYPSANSLVYATNTTPPTSPLTVPSPYVNPNGVTNYTYTVLSSPCGATTASTAVTVYPVPTVGLTAAASSVCAGSSTSITGSASPVIAGTTTYTITASPGGVLYASSTTAPTFPFTVTPTATTTYTYTVTNGTCSPVNATATVTYVPQPTITSFTSTATICATTATTLTFSTGGGTTVAGLTTYKITSSYPSAGSEVYATNTTAPSSPLTVDPTNVNPNGTTTYTYTVTSSPCAATTATFTQTVRPVPTAQITASSSPICIGSSTTLNVTVGNAVGGVTTYAIGTSAGGTNIVATTTIGSSGTFTTTTSVTPPVGNTTYFLTVTTSPCTSVSSSTTVTVNPASVGGTVSAGAIVCPGSTNSTTFTLSGNTGSVINWQSSTNDGSTWTDISNTLTTYTATNVSVSTLYRAVVQSGVCAPAFSSTSGVFVNANPQANFTNTTVCFNTPPTTFTNTSTPGTTLSAAQQTTYNITGSVTTSTTYAWNFGDPVSGGSNTSTATSPTHTYTSAGTFTVTLTTTTSTLVGATTVASCSNTTSKSVTVNPVTTADYTNSAVCLGGVSVLNISNFSTSNTYSVVWGDGTAAQSVTTATASRTFTNPGQYSVRLKVTNPYGCSDSITKNVSAWALPSVTGVNISNTSPCVGSTVNFSAVGAAGGTTFVINPATGAATATVANSATIASYLWDFGNGQTATSATGSTTYSSAGTYTVKLTLTNSNGCSQLFTFSSTPVNVQPNPVANFSATTACLGSNTTFTDQSTISSGTITGWAWNFGNPSSGGNNTSTLQNPTHLFTASGTFTVNLVVTSAAGCTNSVSKQVTVNPLPQVSFNASANSACAGSTLTFNSTSSISSGSITYSWRVSDASGNFNFGASTVSANISLVQTFATAGNYIVRLYAQSNNGCIDSSSRNITIFANPTATIVVNPVSNQICIYEAFTFTSTGSSAGSGSISGYLWNFGDGSTSTAASPAPKSYASPGNYTVTLTVTNTNGCTNTTSKNVTVNPKPIVNFTANNVCFGYTMSFTDASSTSAGSSFSWNFGDPSSGALNTSATQNTSHDFTAAGNYNVKLVVTNASGCKDSLTKTVTVWPRPVANFKADTACEGHITTFTNLSSIASGSLSYLWSFGDANNTTSINTSPTFSYPPGVYSVKLIVTSGFGCIDSMRKSILVKPNPKPKFTASNICLRDAVVLDTTGSNGSASATLSIDYGDGSALTNSLTHTYAMSGTYTIMFTMTDNGCTATISKVVTVYDLPLPSFSVSSYTICVNKVDSFSNTSTIPSGFIASNKWEVINSSNVVVTSVTYTTNQEFTYSFNTAGVFRVRLTSTSDKGCMDSTSKIITVNALPTVTINSVGFLSQAFHACLGTPHKFSSTGSTSGSGTIASYYWNFGDGSYDVNANPTYTYKSVGSFTVTLTITNSNGCSFSKTQQVEVDPIPDATINPGNFPIQTCNGTSFTFIGPSGAGYTYKWIRNGVVVGTAQTLIVTPPASGWYYLIVTSGFGCSKMDSAFLTVNPLPQISLSDRNVVISKGWNKQVTATVTGSSPTFTYIWTPQDSNARAKISNPNIPNPVLTPPNNVNKYYFVLTVIDQKGCIQRDTVFFTMLEDFNLRPMNLMTPNGDGKNDYFEIENIETYDNIRVVVFNRWGNVVYQTESNYAGNKWDGTYKNSGGELPDGTYYYIITSPPDANGNPVIYKGNITIIRGR